MNKQRRVVAGKTIWVVLLMVMLVTACATTPKTFTVGESDWSVIELRDGIEYEKAWQQTVDVLARRFDIEIVEKESGYLRSSWIYTWWQSGKHTDGYRVRALIKFTPEKDAVAIKTDAHYRERSGWITGADTLLLDTLKSDIMGVVGRTTR
ncbi:MAG: hypothetical protein OXE53_14060 [Deltaproteobacteria bacterium]|nr:hypothetical protein [Deltaproteobacteria bacterium]